MKKVWKFTSNAPIWFGTRILSVSQLQRPEELVIFIDKYFKTHSDNYREWNDRGNVLIELHRYEEALASYDKAIKIRSNCYEAWYNRGIVLVELERYEKAIASYDKALKIQPSCYKVWNNRGYPLVKLEHYEEALTSYTKALELKPNSPEAWNNRGNALVKLAHHEPRVFNNKEKFLFYNEGARRVSYKKALELNPEYHEAWHNRSNVCWILGRYLEAIIYYYNALRFHPDYRTSRKKLSNALMQLSHYAVSILSYCKALIFKPNYRAIWRKLVNALRYLSHHLIAIAHFDPTQKIKLGSHQTLYKQGLERKTTGCYEEAITIFRQSLKIKPNSYQAWDELGNVQMILGSYQEAIDSYDQTVTLNPNDYQANHKCGLALMKLGRYAEALDSFDLALTIQPNDPEVRKNRDIAWENLERYLEALTNYNQSLQFQPAGYQVCYNQGVALWNLERYLEAIVRFNHALEFFPSYLEDLYSQGKTLLDLGRYLEAIASFDHALKIQFSYHQAWYSRGLALLSLEQYEEAIASFDQALDIQPDYYQAWYSRGLALSGISRHKEAIISFDKALEVAPSYHFALNSKGLALYELYSYDEAINSFDQALKYQPYSSEHQVLYNRGKALKALGRYEEAIADFDRALQLTQEQFWSALNEKGWAIFKLSGYEAALKTWQEGLKKFQSDKYSQPEGCGILYHSISVARYQYGRQQKNHKFYWEEAKNSYKSALEFLAPDRFCQQRLEVLKDLTPLCCALGEDKEVEALSFDGCDLLARLLQNTPSKGKQFQLWLRFLDFHQLRVDQLAHSPKLEEQIEGLELAEKHKNLCLRYCRYGWSETDFDSPKYSDIQKLLNPVTAIIYWHISPAAITTFILRFENPLLIWKYNQSPNIWKRLLQDLYTFLSRPVKKAKLKGVYYPTATRQLQAFEEWVKDWKEQYQEYGSAEDKTNHPWRQGIEQQLEPLKQIFNIPALTQKLEGIDQLILIPHRDLHLLPLHALFPQNFTITYLPSAQIGIDLQQSRANLRQQLFTVENPRNDLPYTAIETAVIRRLYPDSPPSIKGQQATKINVIRALQSDGQLGVFHFTGHGKHNINQPLESALLLAGKDELTLHDIFQLDFSRYRLVCLSACETGITSKENLIDEFVGLVSGFLYAGSTNVVSSLWAVNELSTAFLIGKFYENLQTQPNVAFALKKAQFWLRDATKEELQGWTINLPLTRKQKAQLNDWFKQVLPETKPFQSPYYWAAFCAIGQ